MKPGDQSNYVQKVWIQRHWGTEGSPFVGPRKDYLVFWGTLPSCCSLPPANFVFTNQLAARFWAEGVDCLFESSTWRSHYCISCHPAKSDAAYRFENETRRPIPSCPKGLPYLAIPPSLMTSGLSLRKWNQETNPIMSERSALSCHPAKSDDERPITSKMKPGDQSHHVRKVYLCVARSRYFLTDSLAITVILVDILNTLEALRY